MIRVIITLNKEGKKECQFRNEIHFGQGALIYLLAKEIKKEVATNRNLGLG
jgi:hypothetical protein